MVCRLGCVVILSLARGGAFQERPGDKMMPAFSPHTEVLNCVCLGWFGYHPLTPAGVLARGVLAERNENSGQGTPQKCLERMLSPPPRKAEHLSAVRFLPALPSHDREQPTDGSDRGPIQPFSGLSAGRRIWLAAAGPPHAHEAAERGVESGASWRCSCTWILAYGGSTAC